MTDSISDVNSRLTLNFIQNSIENQYFDRKSARIQPKDVVKHLIAFANANGGVLVIGIEDDGEITGFNNVGHPKIDELKRVPLDHCKTAPQIKPEEIKVINSKKEDDTILIFHIEPSTKRVIRAISDDVYLRIGDQSKKLNHDAIINLEYDKGERHFEEEIVDRSSIEDIDIEQLKIYKNAINTKLSNKEVLEARGLLVDGKLTVAGMLLFSKNPLKFYPNARLRFLRYEGIKAQTGERLNLTKDINIDGSIPRVIEESKNMIASQLREFQALDASGKFKSVPEYPEFAWLEGIVNALTHRDYSHRGDHVKVIMYDDRLEILSPGKLPNIVDIKNMKYTRYSRNPVIARVLSELGWVKELNEGVKRIYEEMEKFFLIPPKYSEPNKNSVLLRLDNNYVMREIRNNERIMNLFEEGIWDELSDDEKTVIYIAYKENNITTKHVTELLGRSPGYSRKILNRLKDLNILIWKGSSPTDPTQYYKLNTIKL